MRPPTSLFLEMDSTSIYLQIFDLMRLLQRANRFIADDLGTELSIVETFLLIEIDSAMTCNAKYLADILQLDKSVISRHLAQLEKSGFIQIGSTKADKRASTISLNLQGKKFIDQYDQLSNQNLEEKLPRINSTELRTLISGFRLMSDQLHAGPGKLRSNDHPLRVEFRRFTRSIGVMRKSFLNTNLNSAQWQVLTRANETCGEDSLKQLAKFIGLSSSTISSIAKALELKGYATRQTSSHDARQTSLLLTTAGREVLTLISINGEELIRKGMATFTQDKLIEFKNALAKFVAAETKSGAPSIQKSVSAIGPTLLASARAFLVESLVMYRQHLNLPEQLLSSKSHCFACVSEASEIIGVIEFKIEEDVAKLLHFVMSPRVHKNQEWIDFLNQSIYLLRKKTHCKELLIPNDHLAIQYIGDSFVKFSQTSELKLQL